MNPDDVFKSEVVALIERIPVDRYSLLLALYCFLRHSQKLRLVCTASGTVGLRVSQMALAEEELLKELGDLSK